MSFDSISKSIRKISKLSFAGLLVAIFVILGTVTAIKANAQECYANADVVAALPIPDNPGSVFCLIVNEGVSTAKAYANAWKDDFNHELLFANFDNTNYKIFTMGKPDQIHWLHKNHWMVDLAPKSIGGATALSPDKSFNFEDGKFIAEGVFAAGMQEYGGSIWGEIDITTADAPVPHEVPGYFQGLYAYEQFPGDWSFGIRLQSGRVPIAALFRPDRSRAYEISFWQIAGDNNFGGGPWKNMGLDKAWNSCSPAQADIDCRDRFRLELTKDSVTLFVNDIRYFEQTGLPEFPQEFYEGDLHVYFSSVHGRTGAEVIRYHWDDININPHSASIVEDSGGEGGTPTPTPDPGSDDGVTPTPTTVLTPTAIPTPTVVPTATPTVIPTPTSEPGADEGEDPTESEFIDLMLEFFGASDTDKNRDITEAVFKILKSALTFE